MSNRPDDDELPKFRNWIIAALIAAVAIWCVVGFIPWGTWSKQDAGQFGDSFGFVNSLFSGLALAGVIVAIALQTVELRYQRRELQESQAVWQETADAQRASHDALIQQVESLAVTAYLNACSTLSSPAQSPSTPLQYAAAENVRHVLEFLRTRHAPIAEHTRPIEPRSALLSRVEYWTFNIQTRIHAFVTSPDSNKRQMADLLKRYMAQLDSELTAADAEVATTIDPLTRSTWGILKMKVSSVCGVNLDAGGPDSLDRFCNRCSDCDTELRGLAGALRLPSDKSQD